MLFRDSKQNLIEINKKDFATDIDYYNYIIKIKGITKDEYNKEDINDMLTNERNIKDRLLCIINND
tara:strand:- start:7495 stop:7692 length:198 start_codon:yes stop_codon:yes gene_type:complete